MKNSKKYPKAKEYVDTHITHRVCNRCGHHVLISDLPQYKFQCMYCNEDLFEIETYEKSYLLKITEEEYEDLIGFVQTIIFE